MALVHVRNTAIAFSMGGDGLPIAVKLLFFIIVPVILVIAVCVVYFSRKIHLSVFQRWVLALFLGGAELEI